MTRINLIPASELMDQHLFAEFREIKMVPKALRRSLAAWCKPDMLVRIPKEYVLGPGHVTFFYNKGKYLEQRYAEIKEELLKRGFFFNTESPLDPDNMFKDKDFYKEYEPTDKALAIIRTRIAEEIALKPQWYRYYGKTQCGYPDNQLASTYKDDK